MTVVPKVILNKEFISQFKTEEDVSQFMTDLHSQLLEQLLQAEMDEHLGYEKNHVKGNNSGNSRNGTYNKTIRSHYGESTIKVPRDRNGEFEPIVVPKHESTGLSIERLVISLYAKGMSVADIESELREIYKITLSTSAFLLLHQKSFKQKRSSAVSTYSPKRSCRASKSTFPSFITSGKISFSCSILSFTRSALPLFGCSFVMYSILLF